VVIVKRNSVVVDHFAAGIKYAWLFVTLLATLVGLVGGGSASAGLTAVGLNEASKHRGIPAAADLVHAAIQGNLAQVK